MCTMFTYQTLVWFAANSVSISRLWKACYYAALRMVAGEDVTARAVKYQRSAVVMGEGVASSQGAREPH